MTPYQNNQNSLFGQPMQKKLLTETELSAQRKLCGDFSVKKNVFGHWQIEFTHKLNGEKTTCSLRTRRVKNGEPREFKSLDTVANVLCDCGIESFRVEL
jgi:hypothetical protein